MYNVYITYIYIYQKKALDGPQNVFFFRSADVSLLDPLLLQLTLLVLLPLLLLQRLLPGLSMDGVKDVCVYIHIYIYIHFFDTCTQKLHAAAGNVNSPASLLACKIRSYRASVICTQHGQTSVTKGLRNLHSIVNGAATKCLVESLSQRPVQCWGVLF